MPEKNLGKIPSLGHKTENSESMLDDEVFERYFPGSDIQILKPDQLPPKVLEEIMRRGTRSPLLEDNPQAPQLKSGFLVNSKSDFATYAADETRILTGGDKEHWVHLVDTYKDENVGWGRIRYQETSNFVESETKPHVRNTETAEDYQERGFGTRRLLIMNAFSQAAYALPLNSGGGVSEKARRVWDRLVKEGLAKSYRDGKKDRYVFLSDITIDPKSNLLYIRSR